MVQSSKHAYEHARAQMYIRFTNFVICAAGYANKRNAQCHTNKYRVRVCVLCLYIHLVMIFVMIVWKKDENFMLCWNYIDIMWYVCLISLYISLSHPRLHLFTPFLYHNTPFWYQVIHTSTWDCWTKRIVQQHSLSSRVFANRTNRIQRKEKQMKTWTNNRKKMWIQNILCRIDTDIDI